MADVLVIDGDQGFGDQLVVRLGEHGQEAQACQSLARGLALLHTGDYVAVVLCDALPDGQGLEYLPEIRAIPSQPEVLVLSDNPDPERAERVIRNGAWHYMTKPPNIQRLAVLVDRIREYRKERRSRAVSLRREGIVGNSRLLENCLDSVAHAASIESNVLLTGETGTGKELFARAIHKNSKRTKRPFVVVDCAALPDTLVESVLFGHEKGAFTSAESKSAGLVRQADGGTLFLDEVGELPLSIQKVFLRVLEGRCFRAVGGTEEIVCDFRLLAATNRDLEVMVEAGTFRRDLYFRLRGLTIGLPPLRAIPEDINELTCHFIRRYCSRMRIPSRGFSPDFLEALMSYDWPGNIRELINTVERALSVAGKDVILYPRHLPRTMRAAVARRTLERRPVAEAAKALVAEQSGIFPTLAQAREQHLSRIESEYLRTLLDYVNGDVRRACETSGLSRARLYALMKKRGVTRK